MRKTKVAILGGGSIGTSLANGLIRSSQLEPGDIIITDKREQRISYLGNIGFRVLSDNKKAVKLADLIVMSVKPQQFMELATDIKEFVRKKNQLIISTITGVSFSELEKVFGKVPLIRIMPNTALEICESMTCISFRNCNREQEKRIISVFDRLGKTLVIHEELMGAATVIGACGIAFALRFMRAMSQGGIEIGFNSEISQMITAQTVRGAASLIIEKSNHPEMEIDKVTTPQGITISGLNEMEHQGLSSAVIRGLTTSFNKIENMEKGTGK
jgi:pyrroline-5-carboxylate reductase